MADCYIRSQIGLPYAYQPVKTEQMLIHYFDLPAGKVTRVPEGEMVEWFCNEKCAGVQLKKWVCNIKPGDHLEPVTTGHSVMGRGYYVLSGDSEEAMLEAADGIRMFFGMETE